MKRFFRNGLLVLLVWLPAATMAEIRLPVFDAHLHYSEDVHAMIAPERALELMSEADIPRAMVSSTPGPAVELLYRLAPERVVPFLRPYFTRAQRYTWFRDPELPDRLRTQLDRIPYRGIGEFHVSGTNADSDVVRAVIRIAQQRQLVLHAHTDLEGLGFILPEAGSTAVIWAHAGFDVPVATLRRLLDQNPHLFLELSYREGITEAGQLVPEWLRFFSDYPRRFLVGTDTYNPRRWAEITDLAAEARHWLAQLPAGIAEQIAYGNAERLFAKDE
ncbi:MAG: amidohydrolase [Gammaproteobacteria bacterium]|nr:MAG: amidohydrolase [Gammaproteobacteria bacterium]